MNSCLYTGRVRHRRVSPKHEFNHRMFMVCLDLSEQDEVFRGRWLWSTRGLAPAWFRRRDYLVPADVSLATAVRQLVEHETGRPLTGRISVLTHLRYWGYIQNPVTFYFCHEADGGLAAIVAEITNTPWGERHQYVLDAHGQPSDGPIRFCFEKRFHISPLQPMKQRYRWTFRRTAQQLVAHMENEECGQTVHVATLVMWRREISGASLAASLLRFPFMTLKVVLAIYWQALRRRLLGAPFHPHPRRSSAPEPAR